MDQNATYLFQLTPEGILPSRRVYDCAVHVIHCAKHDKLALVRHVAPPAAGCPKGVYWLPFTALSPNHSWHDSALLGSFRVLAGTNMTLLEALKMAPPYSKAFILQILRIQLPSKDNNFLTRVVFFTRLNPKSKNISFKCCQETSRIKWYYASLLADGGYPEPVWGPEVFEFARATKKSSQPLQKIRSYSLETARWLLPNHEARDGPEKMLATARATRDDVDKLFVDYLDHCFPAFYMSIWSFKSYMSKLGVNLDENRTNRLFRAFNNFKNGIIRFHELLLGLAAMDPQTEHNEDRLRFVYRYYDKAHIGVLSLSDFRKMMHDLHPNEAESALNAQVSELASKLNVFREGDIPGLSYTILLDAVVKKLLRKTSTLCRIPKPVFRFIAQAIDRRKWKLHQATTRTNAISQIVGKKFHDRCTRCTNDHKPVVVPGFAKLNVSGQLTPLTLGYSRSKANLAAEQLLAAIRSFSHDKGTVEAPKGVLMEQEDTLIELVKSIRDQALLLYKSKLGKCHQVCSPAYVIGNSIEAIIS